MIIQKFDESMTMKADKLAMDRLYKYVDITFEQKGAQARQDEHLQNQIDQAVKSIKEMKDKLKVDLEAIKKKT